MNPESNIHATIKKQRIRAPKQDGSSLFIPPLENIPEFWELNRQTILEHDFLVNGQPVEKLRDAAREHLIEAASNYSAQYCDVSTSMGFVSDRSRIIISGHQPRLFHPGVWFKNFSLSDLGKTFSATAINLIVDNDLCGLSNVAVPQMVGETDASTVSVAYDAPGGNLPFEAREIVDPELFDSFGERLKSAIAPTVSEPLVNRVWQNVSDYRDKYHRLGHTLAAARHKLEVESGLRTFEVPLSSVCKSQPFAHFVAEILNRVDEFQKIYNQSLMEYRSVHRIRSNAQPVPELESDDGWFEIPFWVWSVGNPVRRALYVRRNGTGFTLSNRHEISLEIDSENQALQIANLNSSEVSIRPRALMTTMYSRTFLSDLFVHGIGGSKYDQLTDAIMARFWNCVPPVFATITATLKLPFDFESVTGKDIIADTVRLREYRFHPERFIESPGEEAQKLIAEKQSWFKRFIDGNSQKARHDAIERCNTELQGSNFHLAEETRADRERKKNLLRRSRILGSRAYSFCCFDDSLIDQLKALAAG